jgi:hypothetical protein
MPIADFFVDSFTTTLEPGELIFARVGIASSMTS